MSRPRFLLDEHVWSGLVEVGKRLGADVVLAQTQLPEGTDDEECSRMRPARSVYCSPATLRISPPKPPSGFWQVVSIGESVLV